MESPPDPPAAVLDTNVVLDWLVFRDAGVAPIAAAVEAGRLRWLATARMRDELADVLDRGHLARWQADAGSVLALFDRHATPRPAPSPSRLHCSDPDDQVFIDLALAAKAPWLITHDRALLALARRARPLGVQILRPGAWSPG